MALTNLALRNAKPRERNWKLADEKGLFLTITPKGSKLWHFKYRFCGKEKKLSFGAFPEITLSRARELRDEARTQVASGKDPSEIRKEAERKRRTAQTNTFSAIARELIEKRRRDGLAEATLSKKEWLLSLLEAEIGARPITSITTPELLLVLEGVQDSGRVETAQRLRSFASNIFDHAIRTGRAENNPSSSLQRALVTPRVRHHPAILEPVELGKLLRAIDEYNGYPSTIGALKFSAHAFQRPGEIRMMRWRDLDLNKAVWIIPAAQTKMRREHAVPLSRQATQIINSMQKTATQSEFVFPAFHSFRRPLSECSVNNAVKRMGFGEAMTAHGFRSTASSLLNESGLWNVDAIERSLAHQDGNAIRRTYNRGNYWDERVRMHQWWSDYLDKVAIP